MRSAHKLTINYEKEIKLGDEIQIGEGPIKIMVVPKNIKRLEKL